jgi:N-ethylmaleimide reductase
MLHTPTRFGAIPAANRVLMAPCTRCRADAAGNQTPLAATYYAQRASAGLIISEATQISPSAQGYPNTPGIYTDSHIAAWRRVTDAVHAAGGRIVCQLWHVGRVSHSAYQPGQRPPVSSSAIAYSGQVTLPDFSKAPAPTPHALTLPEIKAIMADYRHAAQCAKDAGFDGVELHGANGYLPDQFIRDGINQRTDDYGGSIPNRARFHLEATHALLEVWGNDRVGVRLSPSGTFNNVYDRTPRETFAHLVTELGKLSLAFLHIMEAMEGDAKHGHELDPNYAPIPASFFRPLFKGPLITNAGFTRERAEHYLAAGHADAVAWGTLFIANPDLPERFRRHAAGDSTPLNAPDPSTYYGGGEKGYTDYPTLSR